MSQAKIGDTVRVDYTGTLESGEVFDSSIGEGREPLEFTLGQGQMIPGFEKEVVGMTLGETKKINIVSAEAYGERSLEALVEVPLTQFPPEIPLLPGTELAVHTPEGYQLPALIHEVREETVVIDTNHPLAGLDLNFELTLVEIL
jgi:FKBP-type peptidyl-prolyl cis-trans isomerase 2